MFPYCFTKYIKLNASIHRLSIHYLLFGYNANKRNFESFAGKREWLYIL